MYIVSEDICKAVISRADAFTSVEGVFAAMARGDARNFPVVREAIGYADALYGFKSGFDRAGLTLGVKSGGYWPGNAREGLTNHQSAVLLFSPDTGQLQAVVGGNYLTAIRTAAASAVSIAHLARPDTKVLGIIGAGHQAAFQMRAALDQRNFERIVAWNRTPEKLAGLASTAQDAGLPFNTVALDDLCAEADVIITITSSFEPLVKSGWVTPGTHIACMGTDTKGKQEVDPDLVALANVFTDEVAQSVSIGETQHAVAGGKITDSDVTPIGDVINGIHPGRQSETEITLFDGTGVGLQDLAVGSSALHRAIEAGEAVEIAF